MAGYGLYQMYVDGGFFMHPIFLCLLIGLGLSFERFRALRRAAINSAQLLDDVKRVLSEDGLRAAITLCEKTAGSVAAIFHAGLQRAPHGVEHVEKTMMNASTFEIAWLEKNLAWLTLLASLAPLLGLVGTVQSLIVVFIAIERAGQVNPATAAHGIAAALLTTLFGLIVAVIIKTAHNFFTSRIDKLALDMEASAAALIDTLVEMEYQAKIPLNQIGQA